MPYVLLQRIRSIPWNIEFARAPDEAVFHYAVPILDIVAGVIFIIGSACFLPPYDHALWIFLTGCILYVIGGLIYFGIAALSTWEMHKKNIYNPADVLENYMYLLGSFVFLIGTILYWPSKADQIHWLLDMDPWKELSLGSYFSLMSPEFEGTLLFIVGSLMFAAAAFANGLNHNDMSSVEGKLLTATTSLYMAGSILFVMGSVAFLPDLGCNEKMVVIGAVSYIVGSAFYTVGAAISLLRAHRIQNKPELQKLSLAVGPGKKA